MVSKKVSVVPQKPIANYIKICHINNLISINDIYSKRFVCIIFLSEKGCFKFQTGGNLRGGWVTIWGEVSRMLSHQIRIGGLKQGDVAEVKFGGDGTGLTRKDNCTVHTVTLSNSEKALQISLISIYMGPEAYEVM